MSVNHFTYFGPGTPSIPIIDLSVIGWGNESHVLVHIYDGHYSPCLVGCIWACAMKNPARMKANFTQIKRFRYFFKISYSQSIFDLFFTFITYSQSSSFFDDLTSGAEF